MCSILISTTCAYQLFILFRLFLRFSFPVPLSLSLSLSPSLSLSLTLSLSSICLSLSLSLLPIAEYSGVRWEEVSDDDDDADNVSGDDGDGGGGEEVADMETDTTAVQHKVHALTEFRLQFVTFYKI